MKTRKCLEVARFSAYIWLHDKYWEQRFKWQDKTRRKDLKGNLQATKKTTAGGSFSHSYKGGWENKDGLLMRRTQNKSHPIVTTTKTLPHTGSWTRRRRNLSSDGRLLVFLLSSSPSPPPPSPVPLKKLSGRWRVSELTRPSRWCNREADHMTSSKRRCRPGRLEGAPEISETSLLESSAGEAKSNS